MPSASIAGPTLQSRHVRRAEPNHLPADAPNILIVLLDDVGFGLPDTFGGEIATPTLTRLANEGISYNTFHTTSICSPTRAALLTGRNHQRVGSGTIAERALDWDGYTGVIPKSPRRSREVLQRLRLQDRGLRQVAQHAGDRDDGDGPVRPLADGLRLRLFLRLPGRRDLAIRAAAVREHEARRAAARSEVPSHRGHGRQGACAGCDQRQAFAPDKPFFMYWAPGGAHGPHHVFKEWADKYKGKFDDGWDAYRERVFQRQKAIGWIPPGHEADPARRHHGSLGQHPGSASGRSRRG